MAWVNSDITQKAVETPPDAPAMKDSKGSSAECGVTANTGMVYNPMLEPSTMGKASTGDPVWSDVSDVDLAATAVILMYQGAKQDAFTPLAY